MAVAAATSLLEQVNEVMIFYGNNWMSILRFPLQIRFLRNEFEQLHKDLSIMEDFLKDKAETSDVLSDQEMQIMEVLYEMQQTMDTACSFNERLYFIVKQVKSIREKKLRPLLQDWEKLPDGYYEDERPVFRRGVPITQKGVVGFDDEEAKINEYLLKDSDVLDVLPIIGVPGQGKTTLAWKIYQNESVVDHFPVRIWVCISQYFNRKDAFHHILKAFMPSQDVFNIDYDDDLAQMVRFYLEKEKFLLVLDDIWSVEVWNEIKAVLPLSNGKSKVLLTSRDNDVGEQSALSGKPHSLRFLTYEESRPLLNYVVDGSDCDIDSFVDILDEITLKCDGLPLLIVVIGGILWYHYSWKLSSNMLLRSAAITLRDNIQKHYDMGQRITYVMESSYDTLPYDVRYCFTYMSIFPKEFEVPVQMLLRLWIAEGFIGSSEYGRSNMEEYGKEILEILIRMNLLKAEKINHMGKVKTCRIHGMVRDFCIKKSKEYNLFEEMKISDRGEFPPASETQKLRRLCLSSNLTEFFSKYPTCRHMRSFMCFSKESIEFLHDLLDCFPRIRILEFRSIKLYEFPVRVEQLIHLRYLTLFIDAFAIIPKLISRLWNMQTLVVETKKRSITMEANLWRMFQLRHLNTKASIVLDNKDNKWDGEAGENLQTLNRLSADSCSESVAKKAKNLKTLGIYGDFANIFKRKFLKNLHRLEKLKLVNSIIYKLTSEDNLPSLPYMQRCFPPNLKRLTLTNTFLEWEHMSTLALIDTLEVLKLKNNAFIGTSWDAKVYSFHKLQLLLIVNAHLVFWEAPKESFPRLKCLVLKNCENLEEIPVALAKTSLQKLDIDHICKSAVDSARKIAELKRESGDDQFTLNIGRPSCF